MTDAPAGHLMRLTELAEHCRVSPQTVQYYLLLGLIRETKKSTGGHRLFDENVAKRVKLIHRINQTGYPLREIGKVFLKKR